MMGSSSVWMFLIGLGSMTQFHFVGSLGVAELPIFLLAPFIFLMDYKKLRADGFMPFVWLSILTCVGCVISSRINHTPGIFFIKGLAHPYAIFASTVVIHRLLRNNFGSLKWFLIGVFLSSIISVFILQQETLIASGGQMAVGDAAVERVMGNALFWSSRIKGALTLPIVAFYLETPMLYSICANLAIIPITLLISHTSGRAAALTVLLGTVLIAISRKSRRRMARMGRHIIFIIFCGFVALFVFKNTYMVAAKNGYLGYDAQEKFLRQTRGGESALRIIMAGRMELFCGVMACLDRPIFGFGPKAEDTKGYTERYLRDYGSQEDYENYVRWNYEAMRRGISFYRVIPSHSYIAMFWIYYGIVGLFLWIYVLWLFYMYLRKYSPAIPQWYGYICLGLANQLWDIFFSPFAARIVVPCLVVCILFARAVKEGRMSLPLRMEMEARKYDR